MIKKEQLEFLTWEFGVFFHFGIRTFNEGHKDWDMKNMDISTFNPTSLDCEDWIKTANDAGAKYAVLVCKHHDGFANWPSAYTDYSVKNTPWKNGKGDVVLEFVNACRKYNVKIGLYYSPAQFGSNKMNGKEYDDYFINQISELLGNYGKIDYLWFDGCGSEDHEYDTKRIVAKIRELQPNILIFNMWDPDTRWIGNESGLAPFSNKSVVSALDFSVQTEDKDELGEFKFLPGECDCRMRLENWFYSDSDEDTVKSVDELMGLYMYSVGRGSNLLLNIGPDRRGLLPQKDKDVLLKFGQKVRETFANLVEVDSEQIDNVTTLKFDLQLVNMVVIEEEINEREIENFEIKAYPYSYGKPITVYKGATIGHKAICNFPSVRTNKIEIICDKNKKINAKIKYVPIY
jgi:alpha-L-fucosidase